MVGAAIYRNYGKKNHLWKKIPAMQFSNWNRNVCIYKIIDLYLFSDILHLKIFRLNEHGHMYRQIFWVDMGRNSDKL